jgi:HEAT repeat protein
VSAFIYQNLQQLDRYDDEYNEKIIERIAEAIDLVGEPASCTAALDAKVLREDHFVFANLLLAIASSRHRDSESYRLEVLRAFAQNDDPQTRRAAIRALGRMPSGDARNALREISKQAGGRSELAQLSAAFAR